MTTQLDRIENMLKILLEAKTSIKLDGSEDDAKSLREEVKKYKRGIVSYEK